MKRITNNRLHSYIKHSDIQTCVWDKTKSAAHGPHLYIYNNNIARAIHYFFFGVFFGCNSSTVALLISYYEMSELCFSLFIYISCISYAHHNIYVFFFVWFATLTHPYDSKFSLRDKKIIYFKFLHCFWFIFLTLFTHISCLYIALI